MTRENAIKHLKRMLTYMEYADDVNAIKLAIEALEHPEKNVVAIVPCGDAISRQAAIDALTEEAECEPWDYSPHDAIATIKALPSVSPARPTGWIPFPESIPDVDKEGYSDMMLVSFSNCSMPMIGQFRVDSNGGAWYIGDEDETFVQNDLFANAFMPLPEPYTESEDKG